jgi:hypothetical protein
MKKEEYENAIKRIVNRSRGAEKAGKPNFQYIFLVGAGASISSNIPDALTMCCNIQKSYEIKEEDILKYINQDITRYQATFRAAMDKSDNRFISRLVRDQIQNARRPSPDYRWIINNFYNTIAEILIFKTYFSRVVITTNFDPLIYYAFIQNWYNMTFGRIHLFWFFKLDNI